MKRQHRGGYVLPSLAILTLVLILLSGAILSLGTSSLRVATHDQQSDQALYIAEAGLATAAEEYAENGELSSPFGQQNEATGASFEVEVFTNDSETEMTIDSGLTLPPKTVYFRSTGKSQNGTQRVAGALFREGLGVFQVGSLADSLQAINSDFQAYDSSKEDPSYSGPNFDPAAKVTNRGIIASNETSGIVFDLEDTLVDGGVLVGPGGDTSLQIAKAGATTVGSESTLSQPIEIPEFEVPVLESKDESSSAPPVSSGTQMKAGNLTITPHPDGRVTFSNSCFGMTVQPNGDFRATETPASVYQGGNLVMEGNIHDMRAGDPPTNNTGNRRDAHTGFGFRMEDGIFAIQGGWHVFKIDGVGGRIAADLGPAGLVGDPTSGHLATTEVDAPDWLTGFLTDPPGGVTENPLELEPGAYDTVTIDSVSTELADKGVYVIDTLVVEGSGQLAVPTSASEITLYVTGSLQIEGTDAIVNTTKKAPNLTIVYTGSEEVTLAGGAQAYFSLLAEKADLKLVGPSADPTSFYGALIGSTVSVENANFFYDVATDGIGLGTDNSTLTLLSRHR